MTLNGAVVLLFEHAGVRLTRTGDAALIITVRRKYLLSVFSAVVMACMAPGAVVFAAVSIALLKDLPKFGTDGIGVLLFVLVLFGLLATLCSLATILAVIALCQGAFPRTFTIDRTAGVLRFQNVPGFGRTYSLKHVRSIDLLAGVVPGKWNVSYVAWLTFSVNGLKRYLRVQELARRVGPEESVAAELEPLAEALRELLDLPLRYHAHANRADVSWL